MDRKSRLPVRSKSSLDANTLGLPGQRNNSLRPSSALSCDRSSKRTPVTFGAAGRTSSTASGSHRRFKSPTNLDARSSQDPKWQKLQIKKLVEFMTSVDDFPNMVYTNPTTIQSFVCVVSTLLDKLDHRFKVDANNYKIKVPEYMTLLGYPGKCTPNLMKTVYAQYSYPSVVTIWSFLLEQVTRRQLRESSQDCYLLSFADRQTHCEAVVKHSHEGVYLYQKGNKDYDGVLENYKQEIDCLYGTNVIDLEIKQKSKEYNEAREVTIEKDKQYREMLAKLEDINANFKDKQEKIDSFINGVKHTEKIYNEQIQKLRTSNETIESVNESKEAELSKLKKKIAENGHTQKEVNELSDEIKSKEREQKLRVERNTHYMEQISQFDSKMYELKNEVETLVFSINNSLYDCKCVFKDVQNHFLPESGFGGPHYLETIKTKIAQNNLVEILSKLEKKLEEENLHELNTIGKLNDSHAEKRMQLESLKAEYEDIISRKHDINENYKKLHSEKLVVHSFEREWQKLQSERIELSEYENLREKAEERYTYLQILEDHRRTNILNFLKKVQQMLIAANLQIWKLLHNGCKQQEQNVLKINDYISNFTNSSKTLEAMFESLRFEDA